MTSAVIHSIWRFLSLSGLTGPIFDKELRVSSRRVRYYALRSTYVLLLTIFLVLIWLAEMRYRNYGPASFRASRMARAGQNITIFIVWFQFCATQLVAIIMLSTSISDEIYNRTLGLLMTTPINSFQIVMGKLFSRLLQLMLLMAVSLPLLAIVRIFGGVPWDYVLSSICITFTTLLFVSSLSLLFSVFSRRAYLVIILTFIALGVIFGLLPFIGFMLFQNTMSDNDLVVIISHVNPYLTLAFTTDVMLNPRGWMRTQRFDWPVHCAMMLAGSGVLLCWSVSVVRKVALGQVSGRLGGFFGKKSSVGSTRRGPFDDPPRRVTGSAMLWKELRTPIFRRRKITAAIVISIVLMLLGLTYLLCAREDILEEQETQATYVAVLGGLAMLFTIILPATTITSEKESRSWPILMATTLGDWQILVAKFLGIIRRTVPMWLFMFGHLALFAFYGYIHPIALVQFPVLAAWIIIFFTGTGLYFSARFKRTTTAVIMNFIFAAIIWGLIPLWMFLYAEMTKTSDNYAESYMNYNPVIQSIVLLDATSGRRYAEKPVHGLHYNWFRGSRTAWRANDVLLTSLLVYTFVGLFFAWRAKCMFRRNIF